MSDESGSGAGSVDTGGAAPSGPAESSGAGAEPSTAAAPETAQAGSETAAPAETKAERKWRLKYEGKDHEVSSEEELLTLAQKGLGADRRFEDAAKTRKEAEAERAQIRTAAKRFAEDPIGAFAALQGDEGRAAQVIAQQAIRNPRVREQIEAVLLEQMRYEGLPEADRQRIDEDRRLRERASVADRYEAEEKRRQEEAARSRSAAEHAAKVETLSRTYADEARASLAAVGLDPNDPDIAERWILQRTSALDQGVELTAAEAAQRVADRVGAGRKGYLESLTKLEGDALLEAIPKTLLAKINAANAARLTGGKRAAAAQVRAGKAPAPRPAAGPKVEYTADAYARSLRENGYQETIRRIDAGEPLR